MRPMKPKSSPELETVVIDVIEEPVPGVITVTEFEETEFVNKARIATSQSIVTPAAVAQWLDARDELRSSA